MKDKSLNEASEIVIKIPDTKAPLAFLACLDELASFFIHARTGFSSMEEEEIVRALRYYAEIIEDYAD